ncbi:YbbR-like domain-containing protein [Candidatus Leptofilum sp.]|uniref:CdaR family protein n=1 Tax=Candidatus Leptofilum sp. TaxID=3241576 RepID=UPI003B5A8DA1
MMRVARSLIANLVTLILSFILAVIIWVNAMQVDDPDLKRVLQIPATFVGLPEDVTRLSPADDNPPVLITYEGPTSIVSALDQTDFTAIIDLSEVPLGSDVTVPVEIQAENTDIVLEAPIPETVTVRLEKLVTREIDVQLDIRGDVARGHTMGEPLIDPPVITVTGTETEVDLLDFAQVTIFLNDDTQTRIESPQALFFNRQGRVASVSGLQLNTEQVEVTIPINESADFANKVITADIVGEVAPGYRVLGVTIEPSSVLVTGLPTRLAQPFRVQTEPIDITGLTETFQDQVSLDLPIGITLDSVTEITVTVQIEPFSSTKIYNQPIELLGITETLEATISPNTVRVVLFGPSPVLDTLTEQEVRVTLDLFDLEPGEYALEPDVDVPDRGLELRSIQPAVIEVVITEVMTPTEEITETESLLPIAPGLLLVVGAGDTAASASPAVLSSSVQAVSTQLPILIQPIVAWLPNHKII